MSREKVRDRNRGREQIRHGEHIEKKGSRNRKLEREKKEEKTGEAK